MPEPLEEPELEPGPDLEGPVASAAQALYGRLELPDRPPPLAWIPPEWRIYLVWGPAAARGIYLGPHPQCWRGVQVAIGGRLCGSGATLRRVDSWEDACLEWGTRGPLHSQAEDRASFAAANIDLSAARLP